MNMDMIDAQTILKHMHILQSFCIAMFLSLFRHNKTPKVFCLTFGVHVTTVPFLFCAQMRYFLHRKLLRVEFWCPNEVFSAPESAPSGVLCSKEVFFAPEFAPCGVLCKNECFSAQKPATDGTLCRIMMFSAQSCH